MRVDSKEPICITVYLMDKREIGKMSFNFDSSQHIWLFHEIGGPRCTSIFIDAIPKIQEIERSGFDEERYLKDAYLALSKLKIKQIKEHE